VDRLTPYSLASSATGGSWVSFGHSVILNDPAPQILVYAIDRPDRLPTSPA
jgi:hypothetical protein